MWGVHKNQPQLDIVDKGFDLTDLGVKTPVGFERDCLAAYVERTVDKDVEAILDGGGMVLLCGNAAVGQTRTAAELLQRRYPRRKAPLLSAKRRIGGYCPIPDNDV